MGPLILNDLWLEQEFQGSCGLGSVGRSQKTGMSRLLRGVEWGCVRTVERFIQKLGLLSLLPQGWIPDIVLDKRSKPIFPLELGIKV